MKKKIVLIIMFFLSFGFSEIVYAENACANVTPSTTQATLNLRVYASGIPIQSLNRTRGYIYQMSLSGSSGNVLALCLQSGLPASSGLVYKINTNVNANTDMYKKIYRYAQDHRSMGSTGFIVAQAALWMVQQGKSITSTTLQQVIRDIDLSKNCETYMKANGVSSSDATNQCNTARSATLPTNSIEMRIRTAYHNAHPNADMETDYYVSIYSNIESEVENFINYSGRYSGTLYYWESTQGNHQPMLAPLTCGSTSYTCTDKNGQIVDFTDEHTACVAGGKSITECTAELKDKYCVETDKGGVIKLYTESAVCSNNQTNSATSYEYVDTSESGLAMGNGTPISATEGINNTYCTLYCLETGANQIFPGNVKSSVSVGSYIIWPTSEATISSVYKNYYPLKFTGTRECRIQLAPNTVQQTNVRQIYNNLVLQIEKLNSTDTNSYSGAESYTAYVCSKNGTKIDVTDSYNACGSADNEDEVDRCRRNLQNSTCDDAIRVQGVSVSQQSYENLRNNVQFNPYYRVISLLDIKIDDAKEDENRKLQALNTCKAGTCYEVDEAACYYLNGTQICPDKEVECACSSEKSAYDAAVEKRKKLEEQKEKAEGRRNDYNTYNNYVQQLVQLSQSLNKCGKWTYQCSGSSCSLYDFQTNVDLSWGDPEYGRIITDSELEKDVKFSSYMSGETFTVAEANLKMTYSNIKSITNNTITFLERNQESTYAGGKRLVINAEVTYSLPTTGSLLYNYVVKRQDSFKSQTSRPSSDSSFITIGYSNLPVSYNASAGNYPLILKNISFGLEGQYTPDDYTCKYNVTKNVSSNCTCPVGTDYQGKDLSTIMINEGLTCYEAQQSKCNISDNNNPNYCINSSGESVDMSACLQEKDYFTCYDENCPQGNKNKYCPYPYDTIDLTPCLNQYDYNYCLSLCSEITPDNPDNPDDDDSGHYKCKNTNGVDGKMDITSCVITKMAQGMSESQAIDACDKLVCPLSGLRIIYRTISLENPFPSKLADAQITQQGLSIGMFNDSVKGRYPGANWNNQQLVKNHILNVTRQGNTIDGSNIYQNEPLYTFVLTTDKINAIRKYNTSQIGNGGYADYKLDCRLNNSIACVSEFVHKSDLSGLVSGVCANATNRTNFYTCSGD